MPFGDPGGEGGLAQRGYGGVAQPGGNVSSGVGGDFGYAGGAARGRPGFGPAWNSPAAQQARARQAGNPLGGGVGVNAPLQQPPVVAPTVPVPPQPVPPLISNPPIPRARPVRATPSWFGNFGPAPQFSNDPLQGYEGGFSEDQNYGGGGFGFEGRQFGGPVNQGQPYTVGENGPEQFVPQQAGQIIPHNPMDRLGGMNPQMMQHFFQLMQQMRQGQQGRPGMGQPPQQPPQRPSTQPPMGGGVGLNRPQPPMGGGGWQNRMGIAGLSRPMGT